MNVRLVTNGADDLENPLGGGNPNRGSPVRGAPVGEIVTATPLRLSWEFARNLLYYDFPSTSTFVVVVVVVVV